MNENQLINKRTLYHYLHKKKCIIPHIVIKTIHLNMLKFEQDLIFIKFSRIEISQY